MAPFASATMAVSRLKDAPGGNGDVPAGNCRGYPGKLPTHGAVIRAWESPRVDATQRRRFGWVTRPEFRNSTLSAIAQGISRVILEEIPDVVQKCDWPVLWWAEG